MFTRGGRRNTTSSYIVSAEKRISEVRASQVSSQSLRFIMGYAGNMKKQAALQHTCKQPPRGLQHH